MPVLTKINTNSIAEDAITGDKFAGDAYLANTANQNISGTYSENRLYTSDAYTLSGNATVNSHLTLSSVKPTADVVLTASGAYTITGTGVLSAGSLLAKERSDLTGMAGVLGSAVTGSPNLNLTTGTLGSGVTFPSGHILRTFYDESDPTPQSFSAGNDVSWDELDLSIPASSTSDYLIITLNLNGMLTAGSGAFLYIGFLYSTNDWTSSTQLGTREFYDRPAYINGDYTLTLSATTVIRVNHPTTSAYRIRPKLGPRTGAITLNQSNVNSTILAMEVKG